MPRSPDADNEINSTIREWASQAAEDKTIWELAGGLSALLEFEATPKEIATALGFFFGSNIPETAELVVNAEKWKNTLIDWEFGDLDWKEIGILNALIKKYSSPQEWDIFGKELEYAIKIQRDSQSKKIEIIDNYVVSGGTRDAAIDVLRFQSNDQLYTGITDGSKLMILDEHDNDVSENFPNPDIIINQTRAGGRKPLSYEEAQKILSPRAFEIAFGDNQDITPFDLPSFE